MSSASSACSRGSGVSQRPKQGRGTDPPQAPPAQQPGGYSPPPLPPPCPPTHPGTWLVRLSHACHPSALPAPPPPPLRPRLLIQVTAHMSPSQTGGPSPHPAYQRGSHPTQTPTLFFSFSFSYWLKSVINVTYFVIFTFGLWELSQRSCALINL